MDAAKAIAKKEANALPSHGARPWFVQIIIGDDQGAVGRGSSAEIGSGVGDDGFEIIKDCGNGKKGKKANSPLFVWNKYHLELAILPHILNGIDEIDTNHGLLKSVKEEVLEMELELEEGYVTDDDDYINQLMERSITLLSTVAFQDTSFCYPTIERKWMSPDLVSFRSRNGAVQHSLMLLDRDKVIDRALHGVGARGAMLRGVKPTRTVGLEAGFLRFVRDGLWVVGQEDDWVLPRIDLLDQQEQEQEQELEEDEEEPDDEKQEAASIGIDQIQKEEKCKSDGNVENEDTEKGEEGTANSAMNCKSIEEVECKSDGNDKNMDAEKGEDGNDSAIDCKLYGCHADKEGNDSTVDCKSIDQKNKSEGNDENMDAEKGEDGNDSAIDCKSMQCNGDTPAEEKDDNDGNESIDANPNSAVGSMLETEVSNVESDVSVDKPSGDVVVKEVSNDSEDQAKEDGDSPDDIKESSPHTNMGSMVLSIDKANDDMVVKEVSNDSEDQAKGDGDSPDVSKEASPDTNIGPMVLSIERVSYNSDSSPDIQTQDVKNSKLKSRKGKKRRQHNFVPSTHWRLTPKQIIMCYNAVMDHYEKVMFTVKAKALHSELADGFDVFRERGRGRYDMVLDVFDEPEYSFLTDLKKAAWMPVVKKILGDDATLVHKGAFLSIPGAETQVYHQDGVHLNKKYQKPCHAINVFIPLIDLHEKNGPTEFCIGTHYLGYEDYNKHLIDIPLAKAGSPVIFDYRLGHRGLGNNSKEPRPIVYLTYTTASKEFRDAVNFSSKRYRKLGEIIEKPLSRKERALKRTRES